MTSGRRRSERDPAFPVALLGVAVFAGLATFGIKTLGAAEPHDPGPRALPWFVSALLIIGALYELFARNAKQPFKEAVSSTGGDVSGNKSDLRTAIVLLTGMLLYFIAVPWLGFFFCTLIFSTAMMRLLGARWILAIAASAAILLIVFVLFVRLFKVQLPSGITGVLF